MNKFDENNNPVFSKTENFFIYTLLIGFVLVVNAMFFLTSYIYFSAIFEGFKNLVLAYPLLTIVVVFIFITILILLIRWFFLKQSN